jgi:hypothetical protein
MRLAHKLFVVIGEISFFAAVGYGQSLGDVAREHRQQQAKDVHATRRVVTDEDLPQHQEPLSDSSVSSGGRESIPAAQASNDTHAGEQWKAKIETQKGSVAALQREIDRLSSSIHFVESNGYSNGVQYNQKQIQKQDAVRRMQKQLDEQRRQLREMQESARRAGLGSSVYDP